MSMRRTTKGQRKTQFIMAGQNNSMRVSDSQQRLVNEIVGNKCSSNPQASKSAYYSNYFDSRQGNNKKMNPEISSATVRKKGSDFTMFFQLKVGQNKRLTLINELQQSFDEARLYVNQNLDFQHHRSQQDWCNMLNEHSGLISRIQYAFHDTTGSADYETLADEIVECIKLMKFPMPAFIQAKTPFTPLYLYTDYEDDSGADFIQALNLDSAFVYEVQMHNINPQVDVKKVQAWRSFHEYQVTHVEYTGDSEIREVEIKRHLDCIVKVFFDCQVKERQSGLTKGLVDFKRKPQDRKSSYAEQIAFKIYQAVWILLQGATFVDDQNKFIAYCQVLAKYHYPDYVPVFRAIETGFPIVNGFATKIFVRALVHSIDAFRYVVLKKVDGKDDVIQMQNVDHRSGNGAYSQEQLNNFQILRPPNKYDQQLLAVDFGSWKYGKDPVFKEQSLLINSEQYVIDVQKETVVSQDDSAVYKLLKEGNQKAFTDIKRSILFSGTKSKQNIIIQKKIKVSVSNQRLDNESSSDKSLQQLQKEESTPKFLLKQIYMIRQLCTQAMWLYEYPARSFQLFTSLFDEDKVSKTEFDACCNSPTSALSGIYSALAAVMRKNETWLADEILNDYSQYLKDPIQYEVFFLNHAKFCKYLYHIDLAKQEFSRRRVSKNNEDYQTQEDIKQAENEDHVLLAAHQALSNCLTIEEIAAVRYLVLAFRAEYRHDPHLFPYGSESLKNLLAGNLDEELPNNWVQSQIQPFIKSGSSSARSSVTLSNNKKFIQETPQFKINKLESELPAGNMACYQLLLGKPLIWHRCHGLQELAKKLVVDEDDDYELRLSAFQILIVTLTTPISQQNARISVLCDQIINEMKTPWQEKIQIFVSQMTQTLPRAYQTLNIKKKAQFNDNIINLFRENTGLTNDDAFVQLLDLHDNGEEARQFDYISKYGCRNTLVTNSIVTTNQSINPELSAEITDREKK